MNNFTIIIKTTSMLAKRNCGKSCLLKCLVEAERYKFNKIIVICPKVKINQFYNDIVEDDCIFDNYNEKWIS